MMPVRIRMGTRIGTGDWEAREGGEQEGLAAGLFQLGLVEPYLKDKVVSTRSVAGQIPFDVPVSPEPSDTAFRKYLNYDHGELLTSAEPISNIAQTIQGEMRYTLGDGRWCGVHSTYTIPSPFGVKHLFFRSLPRFCVPRMPGVLAQMGGGEDFGTRSS